MFQYLSTVTKKERRSRRIYIPLTMSKDMNERHVNLLLIAADDTNHYCFMKNFGNSEFIIQNSQVIIQLKIKHSIGERLKRWKRN